MKKKRFEEKIFNSCIHSPSTVIELETIIAITQTIAILIPAKRFVERCLEPRGFRIPRYRPRLMKHICRILEEHANTSHVTYTLHQVTPRGQYPRSVNKAINSDSDYKFPKQFFFWLRTRLKGLLLL